MAWYEFWKAEYWMRSELTIIDRLNAHLLNLTFDERVEALKAIVKDVCPGAHVSYNPPAGGKRKPKASDPAKAAI